MALGCTDATAPEPPGAPAAADTLLSVERVRSLGGTRQTDWLTYLAISADLHATDAAKVQDELRSASVSAATAWLAARAIYGYTYDASGALIARAGAGPLWARFYEIGTDRPIFSDRDGVIRYNLSEVGQERRSGYAWYVTTPAATLARYEAWKQTHAARLARS